MRVQQLCYSSLQGNRPPPAGDCLRVADLEGAARTRRKQVFNSGQHSESYRNPGEFITSKTLIASVLETGVRPDCP